MGGNGKVAGWRNERIYNHGEALVSIITVVYNGEKTIRRTIDSIRAQTYPAIEYLIIDGGSKDGTAAIVEENRDIVSCFVSEPDKGIYDAMNKGIAHSRGELIGIINADDWYEPNAIEIVLEQYRKNIGAVYYGLLAKHNEHGLVFLGATMAQTLPDVMIPHPTCFVPKKIYDDHGCFDPSFRIAGDFDLMQRFFVSGVIFSFIPRLLANFSCGGASDSNPGLTELEVLRLKQKNGIFDNKIFTRKLLMLKLKSFYMYFRSGNKGWLLG
jgi:glycosyltransferase involved in cell wall biosynthesis